MRSGFDLAANSVAVIALVEQGVGGSAIRHLAAGQQERHGTAEAVG
jgi:hypothetical protein